MVSHVDTQYTHGTHTTEGSRRSSRAFASLAPLAPLAFRLMVFLVYCRYKGGALGDLLHRPADRLVDDIDGLIDLLFGDGKGWGDL